MAGRGRVLVGITVSCNDKIKKIYPSSMMTGFSITIFLGFAVIYLLISKCYYIVASGFVYYLGCEGIKRDIEQVRFTLNHYP